MMVYASDGYVYCQLKSLRTVRVQILCVCTNRRDRTLARMGTDFVENAAKILKLR